MSQTRTGREGEVDTAISPAFVSMAFPPITDIRIFCAEKIEHTARLSMLDHNIVNFPRSGYETMSAEPVQRAKFTAFAAERSSFVMVDK